MTNLHSFAHSISASITPFPYIASGGLDRCLYVHRCDTRRELSNKLYTKQQINAILFTDETAAKKDEKVFTIFFFVFTELFSHIFPLILSLLFSPLSPFIIAIKQTS